MVGCSRGIQIGETYVEVTKVPIKTGRNGLGNHVGADRKRGHHKERGQFNSLREAPV